MTKKFRQLGATVGLLLLMVLLLISVYTYVLYQNFSRNMLEAALTRDTTCADAIHRLVSDEFTREDFDDPAIWSDMTSPRYLELQKTLNQLRTLNSTRYLYTAKFNDRGQPMYLVDGLPPNSSDFRSPGDLIEQDIVPMLNRCLSGELIESDGVLNTEWGAIFLTCMPAYTIGEAEPIGAVVMEFNADVIYKSKLRAMLYSGALALVIVGGCTFITMLCLRRLATPFYKKLAYTDMLTGIGNRTAFELELKNLEKRLPHPFTIVAYDLNYMKRINDTYGHAAGDAYLRRMAHLLMREEPVRRGLSFRIGGDEFVTLFEGEEEETLLRELEVFHMAGAQAEVNGEPVTFAYGVASYDPALDKGSLHNTLSRADALMYRFKKAARGES